jgi:hypothetical protein
MTTDNVKTQSNSLTFTSQSDEELITRHNVMLVTDRLNVAPLVTNAFSFSYKCLSQKVQRLPVTEGATFACHRRCNV